MPRKGDTRIPDPKPPLQVLVDHTLPGQHALKINEIIVLYRLDHFIIFARTENSTPENHQVVEADMLAVERDLGCLCISEELTLKLHPIDQHSEERYLTEILLDSDDPDDVSTVECSAWRYRINGYTPMTVGDLIQFITARGMDQFVFTSTLADSKLIQLLTRRREEGSAYWVLTLLQELERQNCVKPGSGAKLLADIKKVHPGYAEGLFPNFVEIPPPAEKEPFNPDLLDLTKEVD